jgi:hypothetical protein
MNLRHLFMVLFAAGLLVNTYAIYAAPSQAGQTTPKETQIGQLTTKAKSKPPVPLCIPNANCPTTGGGDWLQYYYVYGPPANSTLNVTFYCDLKGTPPEGYPLQALLWAGKNFYINTTPPSPSTVPIQLHEGTNQFSWSLAQDQANDNVGQIRLYFVGGSNVTVQCYCDADDSGAPVNCGMPTPPHPSPNISS